MGVEISTGQDPAVHGRMEGLHSTIHHLGEAGQIIDGDRLEPRLDQSPVGAAGGDDLDSLVREGAGERHQIGLVTDGQEGATDGDELVHGSCGLSRRDRAG